MSGEPDLGVIAPRSGKAWWLGAGQLLRITDIEGGQSGDLFAVAADDPQDGQSNGRTFDMGGTIRLTTGAVLYSRRSRPLLRIVADEVGVHDMLYAPCSQEMFEIPSRPAPTAAAPVRCGYRWSRRFLGLGRSRE